VPEALARNERGRAEGMWMGTTDSVWGWEGQGFAL
jgi:hypothetical protein